MGLEGDCLFSKEAWIVLLQSIVGASSRLVWSSVFA